MTYDFDGFEREFTPRKPKKGGGGSGKKLAALCLAVAVGATGFGLGIGVGASRLLAPAPVQTAFVSDEGTYAELEAKIAELQAALSDADGGPANGVEYAQIAATSVGSVGVAELYDSVKNSVVSINVKGTTTNYWGMTQQFEAAGSGVVFREDAEKIYIVTNYHVVEGGKSVGISFDDMTMATANYVGGDSTEDIAVISVLKTELAKAGITTWKVIPFADSDKAKTGDFVLAVGNALGEGKSATFGIVSVEPKLWTLDDGAPRQLIKTDAAINNGNSGGALVDTSGRLLGINSLKEKGVGIEGAGFAIPSNLVKSLVDEIMVKGFVERPYLGVSGTYIPEGLQSFYSFPSSGFFARSVAANSTAGAAGVKTNDLITSINGKPVTSDEEVEAAFSSLKVGAEVTIKVQRPTTTGRGASQRTTWEETTLKGVVKAYPNTLAF